MLKALISGAIIFGAAVFYYNMEKSRQIDYEIDKSKSELEVKSLNFESSFNKQLSSFHSDNKELKDFYEKKSQDLEQESLKKKEQIKEEERLIQESRKRQDKFTDELNKDLENELLSKDSNKSEENSSKEILIK